MEARSTFVRMSSGKYSIKSSSIMRATKGQSGRMLHFARTCWRLTARTTASRGSVQWDRSLV